MGREIVGWKVEPLERSRRGLDERILMAAPRLQRLLVAQARRRPPGSRLRRAVITRGLQVGLAAANRGDYESASSSLHRDYELHMRPDDRDRAGDLEPLYRGPDGYVRAARAWKESFAEHRWEPREIFDPGGPRFGVRTEMVGRGLESGVEVRQEEFLVWEVQDGMIRRLWALATEDAMFRLLSQ
jgi:SnoaL-like domain